MRVLQLTKFYSPFRGGIESAVLQLTEGLRDAGVDVEVLCCNTQRRTNREQFSGYRVTRASSLARFLSTSMSPALLFEVMRRRSKHDVIHVHMPDPMAALALYFAKPQARVVVHWHSDVVRQRISLKLYEPLQRWLLRRADRVIATSRDYADASGTLRSWAAKVQVIPLGIRDMHSSVDPEEVAALRGAWGSKRRYRLQRTKATSAMPMGMPGWPDFAFSTASMARNLMVFTPSRVSSGPGAGRVIRRSPFGSRSNSKSKMRDPILSAIPAGPKRNPGPPARGPRGSAGGTGLARGYSRHVRQNSHWGSGVRA